MSTRRRAVLSIALAAVTVALAAGRAPAAGWLAPVDVSPAAPNAASWDLSLQDVAVDVAGDAVAAWVAAVGDAPERVQVAQRPRGGGWSRASVLSPADEEATELTIAVGPRGDAAVAWIGHGAGGSQVARVATRPADGGWSAPVALSDVTRAARVPAVAVDGEGSVTAVWSEGERNGYGVVRSARRPAGGDWEEAVTLSGLAASPQVAVDAHGDATAVWVLLAAGRDDGVVQARTRPAGGAWSAATSDLSGAGGLAREPRLALGADGDATVVWQRRDIPDVNGYVESVESARRVAGGWEAPVTLSRAGDFATGPQVTVDPHGVATAIWSAWPQASSVRHVQTRSRSADGGWSGAVDLATGSAAEPQENDVQVVAGADGAVTAVWSAWKAPGFAVRSAWRAPGGGWSAPVTLSPSGSYAIWPQVAVDPRGHATVVWSGRQGTTHAVRSRVLDPVAPALLDVAIPSGAVAGEELPMSVSARDDWSAVTVAWTFGDGTVATGATVGHCYDDPGARTVTVTATDLAGNASSATRTLAVAPGAGRCSRDEPGPGPGPGPGPKPGPEPGPGPGPGHESPRRGRARPLPPTAPVLSALRQRHARWGLRDDGGPSRLPVGTAFRFRLDRPATVRLSFARIVAGRRVGARCVAVTRTVAPARRCERHVARGTLRSAGVRGANAIAFRGRVGGRTLAPGRYRLRLTATAAGGTSAPATVRFAIAG